MGENLIGRDAMCRLLGISKDSLNRRVRDGSIPYYKIGRLVRFDPREVMEAITPAKRIAVAKGAVASCDGSIETARCFAEADGTAAQKGTHGRTI